GVLPAVVSANLSELISGNTYHYRVVGSSLAGTTNGSDLTFRTIGTNADLSNLVVTSGVLSPVFAPGTSNYAARTLNTSLTVIPTVADPAASVRVNGATVASGSASAVINLAAGTNTVTVVITAEDGVTKRTYTVLVTQGPLTWTYSSASDVPDAGT